MNNWKREKLERVCVQITDGKHGDCCNEENSRFYFLSCKDIVDGRLNYIGARQITEADFLDTHRRTKFAPSDILITNSGTIGRMALAPDNELTKRTTFQKSVAILKPIRNQVDPSFLYYALQSDVRRLIEFAGGTAQKNLLLRDLRAFEVPIPPMNVQQRIASILSNYDNLIEINRRRIAVLEEMARRLFEEWFVHLRFPGHNDCAVVDTLDGPLPEGWHRTELSALCDEIRDGVLPSDVDENTPYVGLEHIPRRSTTLNNWGRAEEVTSTKLRFRKGDVLFGKIRPYFHKVAFAPFEGVSSSDSIVIRSRSSEWSGLVLSIVSSDSFVAHAVATSNGTKMPRANWNVLARSSAMLPSELLLKRFNDAVTGWVELAAALNGANIRLSQSRDLLLPRLFSGELSVTRAEHELEAVA
ncbi:type I restriction enzyme S subunit [Bradyrhizobium japonicum]